MRILTVVGARPQFVKAAVVSAAIEAAGFSEYLVHTGQHYDFEMSGKFWAELPMRPVDLNLECGSGLHGRQTATMLTGIESAILEQSPQWVLVYGDTNSTLAGALAAAKLNVKLAHVEAGLRSRNRRMPEEINRIVTDTLSDLLLAPSDYAKANLISEGISGDRIRVTGDVMLDVSLQLRGQAIERSQILEQLDLTAGEYVLVTIHRAENTDDPQRLNAIVDGLSRVSAFMKVVWPVHPRTAKMMARLGLACSGLEILAPVGPLDMVRLEMSAAVIATDSGGVQKEAFFHRVPCVTIRQETEWPELVESGWNRLAPPLDAASICAAIYDARGSMGLEVQPYGIGHAAADVVAALADVQ